MECNAHFSRVHPEVPGNLPGFKGRKKTAFPWQSENFLWQISEASETSLRAPLLWNFDPLEPSPLKTVCWKTIFSSLFCFPLLLHFFWTSCHGNILPEARLDPGHWYYRKAMIHVTLRYLPSPVFPPLFSYHFPLAEKLCSSVSRCFQEVSFFLYQMKEILLWLFPNAIGNAGLILVFRKPNAYMCRFMMMTVIATPSFQKWPSFHIVTLWLQRFHRKSSNMFQPINIFRTYSHPFHQDFCRWNGLDLFPCFDK